MKPWPRWLLTAPGLAAALGPGLALGLSLMLMLTACAFEQAGAAGRGVSVVIIDSRVDAAREGHGVGAEAGAAAVMR